MFWGVATGSDDAWKKKLEKGGFKVLLEPWARPTQPPPPPKK